jgi:hypothetical protein
MPPLNRTTARLRLPVAFDAAFDDAFDTMTRSRSIAVTSL